MWQFQDFSAVQILREINFGHFEAPKMPVSYCSHLSRSENLNFWEFSGNVPKIKVSKNVETAVFHLLKSAKYDFT